MHHTIVILGLYIHLFSFINEVGFYLSKGLLCLYDKQNNTWLLVDMEFLFSCSREIPYLRAPMYYSPFMLFYKLLQLKNRF